MQQCWVDRWRSNVVTFADGSATDEHARQKHPAVTTVVTRRRVLVTKTRVTGEVRAAAVDNVMGAAADTPVEVLSENCLDHILVSRTVKQLSLDQWRWS